MGLFFQFCIGWGNYQLISLMTLLLISLLSYLNFYTYRCFVILLVISFAKIPAEIYYEQKKKIKELEPDDPFKFIVREPFYPNPEYINVGIDIINKSSLKIEACTSITIGENSIPERIQGLIPMNPYEYFKISGKSKLLFYFANAQINQSNAQFNTLDPNARHIPLGEHNIKVIVAGTNSNGKEVEHSEDLY